MADRRAPLVEVLSVRLDEELVEELDAEAAKRESTSGVRISRAALARIAIRVGLGTMRNGGHE